MSDVDDMGDFIAQKKMPPSSPRLVYVGLILYLVWSIIKVGCAMSLLFRSIIFYFLLAEEGDSISHRNNFSIKVLIFLIAIKMIAFV